MKALRNRMHNINRKGKKKEVTAELYLESMTWVKTIIHKIIKTCLKSKTNTKAFTSSPKNQEYFQQTPKNMH